MRWPVSDRRLSTPISGCSPARGRRQTPTGATATAPAWSASRGSASGVTWNCGPLITAPNPISFWPGSSALAADAVRASAEEPGQKEIGLGAVIRGPQFQVTPLADPRDADHAGAVAVAPVGVCRRPRAGLQPLIGVDNRRSETGQRIGVRQDPAQEPASHV